MSNYVAVNRIDTTITLYRGEDPSKQHEIARVGVVGRLRDVRHLQLCILPPELQVHLGYDTIARHVCEGSQHSPYKSWSCDPKVAAYWATNHNTRPGDAYRGFLSDHRATRMEQPEWLVSSLCR